MLPVGNVPSIEHSCMLPYQVMLYDRLVKKADGTVIWILLHPHRDESDFKQLAVIMLKGLNVKTHDGCGRGGGELVGEGFGNDGTFQDKLIMLPILPNLRLQLVILSWGDPRGVRVYIFGGRGVEDGEEGEEVSDGTYQFFPQILKDLLGDGQHANIVRASG